MAKLRVQELPAMFAIFMASTAVLFQSVMTSARAGDAKATTRQTPVAAIPLAIASDIILMVASLAYTWLTYSRSRGAQRWERPLAVALSRLLAAVTRGTIIGRQEREVMGKPLESSGNAPRSAED